MNPATEYLKKYGITLKTPEQIKSIRSVSKTAAQVLNTVCDRVKSGTTTIEIDQWVNELCKEAKVNPSPLNYRGFPKSVCTSINEVVCHGIPNKTAVKDGDIINIDVTVDKDGFFGDTSRTIFIGQPSSDATRVVNTAKECLRLAIEKVKPGEPLSIIGETIEKYAKKHNCSVVQDFVGHGIGGNFHEEPQIFHYKNNIHTPIAENMIFTIEPMINLGVYSIKILKDGWTAVTRDGTLSAQFEHTILVTNNGTEILTIIT